MSMATVYLTMAEPSNLPPQGVDDDDDDDGAAAIVSRFLFFLRDPSGSIRNGLNR